ncbi:hypothetical protein OG394_27910 [Kribbella sp. NBC_01245]|uniref:hypothetical protein n=1 Tax=Kribbella sp. NBC_01245 TaxID=2903578 RepID=UPI002E2883BA|nr:hypothetical protein [Kribbella sp. NBC_01245]
MSDLFARAKALQVEAYDVLAHLNLPAAYPSFGPPVLIGSALSGLMVYRDLDVMFDAPSATAADVLAGLARLAERPGLLAADFRDERAGSDYATSGRVVHPFQSRVVSLRPGLRGERSGAQRVHSSHSRRLPPPGARVR